MTSGTKDVLWEIKMSVNFPVEQMTNPIKFITTVGLLRPGGLLQSLVNFLFIVPSYQQLNFHFCLASEELWRDCNCRLFYLSKRGFKNVQL